MADRLKICDTWGAKICYSESKEKFYFHVDPEGAFVEIITSNQGKNCRHYTNIGRGPVLDAHATAADADHNQCLLLAPVQCMGHSESGGGLSHSPKYSSLDRASHKSSRSDGLIPGTKIIQDYGGRRVRFGNAISLKGARRQTSTLAGAQGLRRLI